MTADIAGISRAESTGTAQPTRRRLSLVAAVAWFGAFVRSPWWALRLGTILVGATGNLVDRFFRAPGPLRGHVIDHLAIGPMPVFNVADVAVLAGVL